MCDHHCVSRGLPLWDLVLSDLCYCRFSLRQEPASSHGDPARPLWHADRHTALLWRPHHAHHRHSHGQNHVWICALQFPANTSGNFCHLTINCCVLPYSLSWKLFVYDPAILKKKTNTLESLSQNILWQIISVLSTMVRKTKPSTNTKYRNSRLDLLLVLYNEIKIRKKSCWRLAWKIRVEPVSILCVLVTVIHLAMSINGLLCLLGWCGLHYTERST